jgi:hypothetical protein
MLLTEYEIFGSTTVLRELLFHDIDEHWYIFDNCIYAKNNKKGRLVAFTWLRKRATL